MKTILKFLPGFLFLLSVTVQAMDIAPGHSGAW